MPYQDLNAIHNPTTGTAPPVTWGDQIRDNFEYLVRAPVCVVFNNTTQSIPTQSSGGTVLAANSERKDADGMHSTSINNSRITCVTPGEYASFARVEFAASGVGDRFIEFYKNGTTRIFVDQRDAAGSVSTIISGPASIDLVAGDYIEVRARQSSGGNLAVTLHEFRVKWESL